MLTTSAVCYAYAYVSFHMMQISLYISIGLSLYVKIFIRSADADDTRKFLISSRTAKNCYILPTAPHILPNELSILRHKDEKISLHVHKLTCALLPQDLSCKIIAFCTGACCHGRKLFVSSIFKLFCVPRE